MKCAKKSARRRSRWARSLNLVSLESLGVDWVVAANHFNELEQCFRDERGGRTVVDVEDLSAKVRDLVEKSYVHKGKTTIENEVCFTHNLRKSGFDDTFAAFTPDFVYGGVFECV